MAIAYDSSAIGALNTSIWTHICAGVNNALIVYVYDYSAVNPTSVTYNGAAMALLTTGSNATGIYVYFIAPLSTGSFSVVINTSSTNYRGMSVSYTGVSNSGQPDAQINFFNNSNSYVASITVANSNCWKVACGVAMDSGGDAVTVTASLTNRQSVSAHMGSYGVGLCLQDSNGIVATGTNSTTFTGSGVTIVNTEGAVITLIPARILNNGDFFAFF